MNQVVSKFKIIHTPAGEAPEEVRKEWVGLILNIWEINPNSTEYNLIDGKVAPVQRREKITTEKIPALEALAQKNPRAAKWFTDLLGPQPSGLFSFGLDEVTLLP